MCYGSTHDIPTSVDTTRFHPQGGVTHGLHSGETGPLDVTLPHQSPRKPLNEHAAFPARRNKAAGESDARSTPRFDTCFFFRDILFFQRKIVYMFLLFNFDRDTRTNI